MLIDHDETNFAYFGGLLFSVNYTQSGIAAPLPKKREWKQKVTVEGLGKVELCNVIRGLTLMQNCFSDSFSSGFRVHLLCITTNLG